MKRFLFLLAFVSLFCLIPTCFKSLTCGFKLAKMEFLYSYQPDWDLPSRLSKEELAGIFSQPFTYLNRGAQSYVFVSQDERYVLKFFRHHDRFRSIRSSQQKRDRVFDSTVLAYTKAQDETGILFTHLNKTEHELPSLQIKGPLGQKFLVNLNSYRFVLQNRVVPFESSLLKAYHSSDKAVMARHIDSFLKLVRSRVAKGIKNTDLSLCSNFGFLNGEAIEIDFGNYVEEAPLSEENFSHFTNTFRCWLVKNTPEWVPYFDNQL